MNEFKAQTAIRGKMNEKLICLQTLLWSILSILHYLKDICWYCVPRVKYKIFIYDDYFMYFYFE